jgi:hypothetical protein
MSSTYSLIIVLCLMPGILIVVFSLGLHQGQKLAQKYYAIELSKLARESVEREKELALLEKEINDLYTYNKN